MSMARRTLLTTTAAGTLLCALWFVPSANANDETGAPGGSTESSAASSAEAGGAFGTGESASEERLADTGAGVDTTPYLVGGTASLFVGAGFVAYSVRRGGTRVSGI
ncbi:hypothetical protein [Streptomyces sp. NPDC005752]|uniref:hypothetical protein n=1 Tax=Streptomyces sp. NPDC005752 TaxID=3157065 RepID=UPI0033F85802